MATGDWEITGDPPDLRTTDKRFMIVATGIGNNLTFWCHGRGTLMHGGRKSSLMDALATIYALDGPSIPPDLLAEYILRCETRGQ